MMGLQKQPNSLYKINAEVKSIRREMENMTNPNFSLLIGKILTSVEIEEESIYFNTDKESFISCHMSDCCESVQVYELDGLVKDILNAPILEATEEYDSENNPPENAYSFTWTTQTIKTTKGQLIIKWLGESNGYYTEVPRFRRTHNKQIINAEE